MTLTIYPPRRHPRARVRNTVAQTTVTGNFLSVEFDDERYDVGGCHDTSTDSDRLTVPPGGAGLYMIGGHIRFASNTTGFRIIRLRQNGGDAIAGQTAPAINGAMSMSISTAYELAVADFVTIEAFQNTGGDLDVLVSTAQSTEFWFHRLSDA